jgi:hypothetical protein
MPAALKDVALAVRLDVLTNGRRIPEFAKNLTVKGALRHPLPLALNQQEGEYRVQLTDVVSGSTQGLTFRVKWSMIGRRQQPQQGDSGHEESTEEH